MSPNTLEDVFNHIAFPPKVPGSCESEEESEAVDRDMNSRMLGGVRSLKDGCQEKLKSDWESIQNALSLCQSLNSTGFLNKESLLEALQTLRVDNPVILHISQQNACLLIRKPG